MDAQNLSRLPWPISVGLWFVEGRGGDRFTSQYKEGLSIPERIKLVGKMRGVKGFELHLPYEVTDKNFDEVRKLAREEGLKIVTVVPGLFNEMRFKDGALASKDKAIRREAIDRIKQAMEMNEELRRSNEGGYFAIFWPASDGVTYPFESYHPDRRKWLFDGLLEALQGAPGVIAIEHKPADPAAKTYSGTTGETILLCRDLRAALGPGNEQRVGMNPEMAHLLMADANLGADISLILEEKLLLHTHWNTIRRGGADLDMIVGSDNWNDSAEVFFWLDEFKYDRWLGLDLMPKNEDTMRAVDLSIEAMERMYAEVMAVKSQLKNNMRSDAVDATQNLELLLRTRGTPYEPLT